MEKGEYSFREKGPSRIGRGLFASVSSSTIRAFQEPLAGSAEALAVPQLLPHACLTPAFLPLPPEDRWLLPDLAADCDFYTRLLPNQAPTPSVGPC